MQTNTVEINIVPANAPPPPVAAPPILGNRVNVHKAVALGNLACGAALAITNVIGLFSNLDVMTLQAFTVYMYVILSGVALAFVSLSPSQWLATYFGFSQFPAGSGLLLILIGILALGTASDVKFVGWICIAWGILDLIAHIWLRRFGAAFNVHLRGAAATRVPSTSTST